MTPKQRGHAALAGLPVDRTPITVLYNYLYHCDHFEELTGRPGWAEVRWRHAEPDAYVSVFQQMQALAPFEMLQPHTAPPRALRESVEFIEQGGRVFRHGKRTGQLEPLPASVSGHPQDYIANET